MLVPLNKKSQIGLLLIPTMFFVIALGAIFLFSAPKIDESIGGKQAAVLRAVGMGEQELSFVDVSARLAAWQSLFELGESGGFYFDIGDDGTRVAEEYPCDKFVYNLWNARSEKCWPDARQAYKQYFDKNLRQDFFSQQQPKNKLNRITYNYEVNIDNNTRHTFITGLTNDTLPISIIYEEEIIKEKISRADTLPEKEQITKCCDGECVVSVADYYNNRYGAVGLISLPYVWGGVTPYPVEVTLRDQEKHTQESFFYGAYIHYPSQPEPYDTKLTIPGFDCSGFVWWVYKHADIKNFEARQGAKEYERLAKENKYTQTCGFSKPCTQELIRKDAKPGDLLFKHNKPNSDATHIAIYAGDGYIIDSSSDSNGINKRTLPDSWLEHLTVYRFPYNNPSSRECVFGRVEMEVKPTTGEIPENAYNRIMRYDEVIKEATTRNKISEALIKAVIMQESGGDENAVSPTGCRGIMQFCEGAAVQYGLCDKRGCRYRDDRTDPEKSINAGAEYFRDLLKQFNDYAHKDAFAIASYNVGPGVVKKAIKNTGKEDPSWREIYYTIDSQLIYDVYCDEGRTRSGHFCMQGDYCINDRCASKVNEVRTYVDNVLKYIAAFGGGTFSTPSTYDRIFTKKYIGDYFVNPSFTTEVDYDLGVYEAVAAWAEDTYKTCSGSQKDLSGCVKNETKKWNQNYEVMMNQTRGRISSQFLFKFEDFGVCDDEAADYYEFIEIFENCLEFGRPTCYCKFSDYFDFYKVKLSNKSITLYDKDGVMEYYDFTGNKKFNLYHDGQEVDYMIIKSTNYLLTPSGYEIEYYFTDSSGQPLKESSEGIVDFFLVKDGLKLDDFVPTLNEIQKCDLKGKQHKFRFCVSTPQKIYAYDKEFGFELKKVNVKFALDLYDAPPPAITTDSEEVDKPQDILDEEEANLLTEEKECEGLGNAEFKLKATTSDLKPAYEGFITNLVSTLLPQLKVLLFAQNFLVTKDFLPALVNVELDLKGASENCDIAGLVYKCGVGVVPYNNGKFDFSNPTGYVDVSSRFNSESDFSVLAPDACMLCNNPDGSLMDNPIKYTKPLIDGDIVSFSVTKCTDPITQYKKMSGVDIITSALNGFGYYFAFTYVDSAGNYGPATLESVEIPSVLNQLEDQLGIKDWLVIKDIVTGNYDSVFGLLGLDDEWQHIRSALAGASLDRLLVNLRGNALDSAYDEIAKSINNEDAMNIFNDLARDGRLDNNYAGKLLDEVKDKLDVNEVDNIIGELESTDLRQGYDSARQLPLEKKKELLEEVYDNKGEIEGMSEREVDARLRRAMRKKEDAIKIIQSFDSRDKADFVRDMITQNPKELLGTVSEVIGDNKKAEAVRNVLGTVSDAESGLARIMAYASPDYAKKAAVEYITDRIPGFDKYKDIMNIFTDFEGPTC